MNTIKTTLSQAYKIVLSGTASFSYEAASIRCHFLSPEKIRSFDDPSLYIRLIQKMMDERNNFSFPDQTSSYEEFFSHCISLNQLRKEKNTFSEEEYLSYVIRLFENIKTPYYHSYFIALYSLRNIFTNSEIFDKTLQGFYSFMIKTSSQKLDVIRSIAKHADTYTLFDEQLISGILLEDLSVFAQEKDMFPCSLDDYYIIEKEFLSSYSQQTFSLEEFLSERMIYFYNNYTIESTPKVTAPSSSVQHIDSEFLNQYAYNMNERNYITDPAIGRKTEISDLELILISPKKSPILIGQSGVGKTSIVEGLSYLLRHDEVPALLKGKKIFKLTTTSLLSGTKYVGEMEERMKHLMDELAKHPDVILFIDEIHTIVGAGSTENSNNDISNMLKPYIDRGDIKIIGATTSDEYQRFIAHDQALSRRFYPISVEEPDDNLCLEILEGSLPSICHETNVNIDLSQDEIRHILQTLIHLSSEQYQPKDIITHKPELPLSLLEMAFSYAALFSHTFITLEDFIKAVEHSNRLTPAVKKNARSFF